MPGPFACARQRRWSAEGVSKPSGSTRVVVDPLGLRTRGSRSARLTQPALADRCWESLRNAGSVRQVAPVSWSGVSKPSARGVRVRARGRVAASILDPAPLASLSPPMCERVVRMAMINAGAICRAITSQAGRRPSARGVRTGQRVTVASGATGGGFQPLPPGSARATSVKTDGCYGKRAQARWPITHCLQR